MTDDDTGIYIFNYEDEKAERKKSCCGLVATGGLAVSLGAVSIGVVLSLFEVGVLPKTPDEIGLPIAGVTGALSFMSLCTFIYKLARHSMIGERQKLIAHHTVDSVTRQRLYSLPGLTTSKSRLLASTDSVNLSRSSSIEMGQSIYSTDEDIGR